MVEKLGGPNDAEVIDGYIDYHRMVLDNDGILRRLAETPWAVDFISDLVYEDPSRCWRLLCGIATKQPANDVMGSLGVTLGSLLREQPSMMDTIEKDVRTDKRLVELISYIMEDEYIRPDIWARIEAISSKP